MTQLPDVLNVLVNNPVHDIPSLDQASVLPPLPAASHLFRPGEYSMLVPAVENGDDTTPVQNRPSD